MTSSDREELIFEIAKVLAQAFNFDSSQATREAVAGTIIDMVLEVQDMGILDPR